MAHGLRIYGDDNYIQIDESYVCVSLLSSGTATANTSLIGFCQYHDLVITSVELPILALRVTKPTVGKKGATIARVTNSGSTWTFRILVYNSGSGDWTYNYYVYGKPPSSTSGYGLLVKDSSGNLTYNSNYSPLDIATGGSNMGFILGSRIDYQENFEWDSEEMEAIYYYTYDAEFGWIDGTTVVSETLQFAGGSQTGSPPNTGMENTGFGDQILPVRLSA